MLVCLLVFATASSFSSACVDSRNSSLRYRHGAPVLRVADRLAGLVVKASASRAEDPGFESRLRRDFFGVESYQ